MAKRPTNRIEVLRRELEQEGYVVRRRAQWIKHSFEVDKMQLAEMKGLAAERKKLLKDAINEALAAWIEVHRVPPKPPSDGRS